MKKLIEKVEKVKYKRSQAVYEEAAPVKGVYIVYEGRFELSK
jgi:CRP-like cAMP-binding protein